jgi:hypothetical protein
MASNKLKRLRPGMEGEALDYRKFAPVSGA